MRQCQSFGISPRSSTEDGRSFYLVQAVTWFGYVFSVMGDVLNEFSRGAATALAYYDASGTVRESVGGIFCDDDWCTNQSERLINLEFSFIEASPYGGVSAGSTGVWSGNDSKDFLCVLAIQVDFIIDVVSAATFFFLNIIIVGNSPFQFRAGLGFSILFLDRGRNPRF